MDPIELAHAVSQAQALGLDQERPGHGGGSGEAGLAAERLEAARAVLAELDQLAVDLAAATRAVCRRGLADGVAHADRLGYDGAAVGEARVLQRRVDEVAAAAAAAKWTLDRKARAPHTRRSLHA